MEKCFEDFKKTYDCQDKSETEIALVYLRGNFIKHETRFPPMHFLHQIYALIPDRARVSREACDLCLEGKVVFYNFGLDSDPGATLLVFADDVKQHILNFTKSKVVRDFVDKIPLIRREYIDADELTSRFSLSSNEIRELVMGSVFIIRDVGSYWLSLPMMGQFRKSYSQGKKDLLRIIRRVYHNEVLETELRKRMMNRKATLGTDYYIADVIGSRTVKCIPTTSGRLLHYPD